MPAYYVTDYGARADGTVQTAAVQSAIDACRDAGGGQVRIEGGRYVIGTIRLYSNIDLHIAASAALVASSDTDDFPDTDYGFFDPKKCPRGSARSLIFLGQCENTSISGLGTIDCNGAAFLDAFKDAKGVTRYRRNTDAVPGRMIFVMGCRNIALSDFTVRDMAGGWGCWINDSTTVTVNRVKMFCDPAYPNADGVHINCSEDVIVSDCILHTGDDSVVIRANCNTLKFPRPCRHIIVRDCSLSSGCQAVRIGWRGDYEISDCLLSGLLVDRTVRGLVVELPDHSSPFDVGACPTCVHGIRFENITLRTTDRPVYIVVHPDNPYGGFHDISFSGIRATAPLFPTVLGREDAVIGNVSFTDCDFTVEEIYDTPFPTFRFVDDLQFRNTAFHVREKSK